MKLTVFMILPAERHFLVSKLNISTVDVNKSLFV
jgi:hypothetical protein